MSDEIKKLELRITELENQLKAFGVGGEEKIDPKDMEVFRKVSNQLGFDPDSVCGINECKPCIAVCRLCNPVCKVCTPCRVCTVCKVCKVCIFECSCGPCNVGGYFHGADRFSDLG